MHSGCFSHVLILFSQVLCPNVPPKYGEGRHKMEGGRSLSPVFRADKVVSGDGEDRLEEESGAGGGVEGEGPEGAVDVVCTAVPGGGGELLLTLP